MDSNIIFSTAGPYLNGIMFIFLVIMIFTKGGNFRAGKDGIEISTDKKRKLPRCATCVSSKDVLRVFISSIEKGENIQIVRNRIMEDQMKIAEAASLDIRDTTCREFVSILAKKIDGEVVLHPEFKTYEVLLILIEHQGLAMIRKWYRENNFARKPREEEERYIIEKTNIFAIKCTEMFNTYWRGSVIERSELYRINKVIEPQIKSLMAQAMKTAFEIARRGAEDIKRIEEEYRQLVEDTIVGGPI